MEKFTKWLETSFAFRAETAKNHESDVDCCYQGLDDAAAALHSGRLYLLRRHGSE